tara:strand:+ start:271 stop:1965 length:1695 start_codon:yes stop_codon:yes gene_type:complete
MSATPNIDPLKIKGNKLDAIQAPGVSDDSSQNYSVGSKWVDVTNDKVYFCTDATVGAATWSEVGSGGGGNTIYTADDSLTGNRTVDLDNNKLTFDAGQTYIESGSFNPLVINRKGSGTQGNGIDFNAYNSSNAETNFARVIQVATDNTAGSEDGGLWFRVSDGGSVSTKMEINSNAIKFNDLQSVDTGLASNEMWSDNGFLRVGSAIGNGITLYETDGTLTEDRTVNIGNNKLNLLALGGSTEIKSNGVNPLVISRNLTGTQGVGVDFNAKNSSNIQHNFARVIQVATSNTAGSEDGGLWLRVSDNGNITTKVQIDVDNTEIKNKAILESTLDVYGTGTTGNSLLSLYDGQATPVKLWDFLDNGNVNLGVNSVINQDSNVLEFSNISGIGGLKFTGTSNNGVGLNLANSTNKFDFVVAGSSNTNIGTGSLGLQTGNTWKVQITQTGKVSIGSNFEPISGYDLSVEGGIRTNGQLRAITSLVGNNATAIAGYDLVVHNKASFGNEFAIVSPAGTMQFNGYRAQAAVPNTATFPNDKDLGIHENTSTGVISLAYNNNGTIVSVQLT